VNAVKAIFRRPQQSASLQDAITDANATVAETWQLIRSELAKDIRLKDQHHT
jgi:hypothetical protein